MSTFTVEIKEASRELSTIERVKMKETTNAVKLETDFKLLHFASP